MLFADLTGYTGLTASLDPEEVYRSLRPGLLSLQRVVEEFGGTVPQIMGDGFMAVFGVPVAHEDDAERAVHAALAVRDHATELNAGRTGIPFPEVHAGVNSGEVMVAPSAEPAGFAVVGDTVNTASRLADLAPGGTVLVDEQTKRATDHSVRYGPLRVRHAKGKGDLATYEALGRARAGRRPRTGRLAAAAFVDREGVITRLLSEVRETERSGGSRVLVVTGEPGIGKSRLADEFRRCLPRGSVLTGRCRSFGQRLPLGALAEAVASATGVDPEAPTEALDEALSRLAGRLGGGRAGARALARDLGLLLGTRQVPAGQARASIRDARRAVRAVVEGLARVRPLVVVLDDFHWADPDLRRFVEDVNRSPLPRPVLFLAFCRPEAAVRRLPTLDLGSLGEVQMRELATALLGSAAPEDLLRAPLVRAGGNPLFLEETLGMLIEAGALVAEDGGWRVADAGRLEALPSAIRSLIAARIDGLPPDEKRVLQHASVSGESAWDRLVEAFSDVPDPMAALSSLTARGLLRKRERSVIAGSVEYEIKHVLIRDVAYESIPRAERARQHLQIAGWIRRQATSKRDEPVAILAHHYERAWRLGGSRAGPRPASGSARLAVDYLGRWADRVFAYQARRAEELYARAIGIADETVEGIDAGTTARLLIGRAESLLEMGRHREAVADAARARDAAKRLGDGRLVARALLALGRAESDLGRMSRSRRFGEEALRRFEAHRDLRGQGWAFHRLSETWSRSDVTKELDHLRRAHRLFARSGDRWGRAIVAQDLAYLLTTSGGREFERWYAEARRLAEDEGDLRSRASLLRTWGYVCFYRGEYGEAIRTMHEARPLAADAGDRYAEADTLIIEAMATAVAGDPAAAEVLSKEVLHLARELESGRIRALGLLAAVGAAARGGSPGLAARRLAAASMVVREQRIAVDRAEVERVRLAITLDRGAWGGVRDAATRMRTGVDAGGVTLWRPLEPLFRGRAMLGAGRPDLAEHHLLRAAGIARSVGTGGTLELAEVLLDQAVILSGGRSRRGNRAPVEAEARAVAFENRGLRALAAGSADRAVEAFAVAVAGWSSLGQTCWLGRALALQAVAVGRARGRRSATLLERRAASVLVTVGTPARYRSGLLSPLD